jgi:hypothetical protein
VTARNRARLARSLSAELRAIESMERAERLACSHDSGFGIAALAAVTACPPGARRRVEAEIWARRAGDRDVATIIRPDMNVDEIDALTELHVALEAREAA